MLKTAIFKPMCVCVEADSFDRDRFTHLLSNPNLNTEAVDKVLLIKI